MDPHMLDGNAVAGLLERIYAVEMTTVIGICASCEASEPIGATHCYRGAGIVLRCPHCESVLVKIVERNTQLCIDASGLRAMDASSR